MAAVSLALDVLLACALAGLCLVLLQVMRQNGRIMLALAEAGAGGADSLEALVANEAARDATATSGLPVGATAPAFSLASLAGRAVTVGDLTRRGVATVLIFVDPQCGPCVDLVADVVAWRPRVEGQANLVIVGRGGLDVMREMAGDGHPPGSVLAEDGVDVASVYGVAGTPAAVAVTRDGLVGSPVAYGPRAVLDLVTAQAKTRPAPPPMLSKLTLSDRAGDEIRLADLEPGTTLLFWNDSCPYCAEMRDGINRWYATAAGSGATVARRLVVLDSGDAGRPSLLAAELSVLLDPGFSAGRALGVRGTPSALVVADDGSVAAPALVGGRAILAHLDLVGSPVDLGVVLAG